MAGNLGDEDVIKSVVAAHRERYGRLRQLGTTIAIEDAATRFQQAMLENGIEICLAWKADPPSPLVTDFAHCVRNTHEQPKHQPIADGDPRRDGDAKKGCGSARTEFRLLAPATVSAAPQPAPASSVVRAGSPEPSAPSGEFASEFGG